MKKSYSISPFEKTNYEGSYSASVFSRKSKKGAFSLANRLKLLGYEFVEVAEITFTGGRNKVQITTIK